MYTSSEGSDETELMRMLARALAARGCEKYQNLTCYPIQRLNGEQNIYKYRFSLKELFNRTTIASYFTVVKFAERKNGFSVNLFTVHSPFVFC